VELDQPALRALAKQLAALKFDLAIDLRKEPDTRTLLQMADAPVTAGFEYHDRFPWLDVTLPHEGHTQSVHKRRHAADDLLNLVDAVVAAGRSNAYGIDCRRDRTPPAITSLLAQRDICGRRLVCLHAGAGNATKQWPTAYFADLTKELLATEEVDIVLIGGSDDRTISRAVGELLGEQRRVHDLTGMIKLEDLPYFLRACALFVGNDSGPKHIAASVGIPVVGIHSGVVDAREWGPLGDASVALQRDMICSPCYKSTRQECDRGMACLEGLSMHHVLDTCRRLLRLSEPCPAARQGVTSNVLIPTLREADSQGISKSAGA
jgi:ADP-heptose:LPS heptosyltransferase